MRSTPAVTVPATCANLGPGFDALALAVDLHLRVEALARTDDRVSAEGAGADELPTDDGNLIWRAFVAACRAAGAAVPDVSLRAVNAIPLERGMGSSAAAAVAGLALARAVGDLPLSDAEIVGLAADLEGHPDNAAAAVHGGVVLCAGGRVQRHDPTERLRPVLCVPRTRQSTAEARALLPGLVPLAEAAANGARTAAVLAGLTGLARWEPAAMVDVLHEPARLDAMPATQRVVTGLRGAGIGACLSGAGPSVLAVVQRAPAEAAEGGPDGSPDGAVEHVRTLVREIAGEGGGGWDVLACDWERAGAVVEAALRVPAASADG